MFLTASECPSILLLIFVQSAGPRGLTGFSDFSRTLKRYPWLCWSCTWLLIQRLGYGDRRGSCRLDQLWIEAAVLSVLFQLHPYPNSLHYLPDSKISAVVSPHSQLSYRRRTRLTLHVEAVLRGPATERKFINLDLPGSWQGRPGPTSYLMMQIGQPGYISSRYI